VDLAKEIGEGVKEAGGEVKLTRVKELFPPEVVKNFNVDLSRVEGIPEAQLSDLEWADGIAMGSPTRYGNMAGPLEILPRPDEGTLVKGVLYGKPVGFFTEASTIHGGHKSTILAMSTFAYHHGMVIVPLGYAIKEIGVTRTGVPHTVPLTWALRPS